MYPLPPFNVLVSIPFSNNIFDIYFEDPNTYLDNRKQFEILGVNIYKSYDSEYGPYKKINDSYIQSQVYRDSHKIYYVQNQIIKKENLLTEIAPYTLHLHKFLTNSEGSPATIHDVKITVNNQLSPLYNIKATAGIVTIDPFSRIHPFGLDITKTPEYFLSQDVRASYYYEDDSNVNNALRNRVFYKVATVGKVLGSEEIIETPLNSCKAIYYSNMESEPYFYRTINQRMNWLLNVAGEMVYLFVRKKNGPKCSCYNFDLNQSLSDCPLCYGTGIFDVGTKIGGYEGPYKIYMSGMDRNEINGFEEGGMTREADGNDLWTLPSPVISNYDLIVKQNAEVYSIGDYKGVYYKGKLLMAQKFNLNLINPTDIIYEMVRKRMYNKNIIRAASDQKFGISVEGMDLTSGNAVLDEHIANPMWNKQKYGGLRRRGTDNQYDNQNNHEGNN